MEAVIEATGITKHFGDVDALAGVDLVARRGEVLAVLGPNGAGKTTFVNLIATLVQPDAGTLVVAGHDVVRSPEHVRRAIALAGQSAAVEPAMSGRENVEMVARLVGFDRRRARQAAARVLDTLDLSEPADRLARTYSGGMRRRLDLAASLVGAPQLLLLDEPTTGLDPRSRLELWDAIRALVARGTDVLLTTQYLDEADHLADRIAIFDHGRVVAAGRPDDLKRRTGNDVVEVHARDAGDLPAIAEAFGRLGREAPVTDATTRRVTVAVDDGTKRLREAVRVLDALRIVLDDIALRRPTLDEAFLALTGRPRGDGAGDGEPCPPATHALDVPGRPAAALRRHP